MTHELQVRRIGTNEVVKTVDVKGKSDAMVIKVMSGMLRNMDTERFYVQEVQRP